MKALFRLTKKPSLYTSRSGISKGHLATIPTNFSRGFCTYIHSNKSPSLLNTITHSLSEEEITQDSMLLKLEDLVEIPDSFAVVHIGGKQYKVTKNDHVMVDTLDVPVQTKLILDKVLLVGSADYTVIGKPILTNAKVLVEVEEHDRSKKVQVFKMKRRKGQKTRHGHRQMYTLLRVLEIMGKKSSTSETSQETPQE